MFGRKKRIANYKQGAIEFVRCNYVKEVPKVDSPDRSTGMLGENKYVPKSQYESYLQSIIEQNKPRPKPHFSIEDWTSVRHALPKKDNYDSQAVDKAMATFSKSAAVDKLSSELDGVVNQTFVDAVILYMREKDLNSTEVYKPANIDRKLFSKMLSDKYYKPSKDTAIAIALALKLSLDDATDLISRA